MKKLTIIALLLIANSQLMTAQNSFDEMFKEMEQLQQEMLKQFEQFNENGQGFQFFMDTTIIQDFGGLDLQFGDQLLQQIDPAMFEEMFQEMQQQLSQMDQQDWAEIEQLFKKFGMMQPLQPLRPEVPGDSTQPKGGSKEKKEKKRKVYKM